MISYTERLKKQGNYDLSFEPKSFWEYSRGSHLDKLIDDSKSYDHNPVANHNDFFSQGRGTFLSKFNSEYAKRIIEMWSKEGDLIMDPFAGRSSRPLVSTLLERNYFGFDVLKDNLDEAADVVMSDMAVNTTGIKNVDSIQTGELCKEAMTFSKNILDEKGFFISKIFMGNNFNEIVALGKKIFKEVKVFKPQSSRKDSKESFIICKKIR